MSQHDGGPAFPHDGEQRWCETGGMTLRDYFAGEAIHAMGHTLAFYGSNADTLRNVAATAYRAADAMLAARGKVDPVREAAPELLLACRGLLDVCTDYLTHAQQHAVASYIAAARAALLKAEGGGK